MTKEKRSFYHKRWYKEHREERKKQIYQRKKELMVWFQNLKSTLKCENCPESHVATLDFHHINPKEKDLDVTMTIKDGWAKERILKEIAKCKVLCSNCHRKFHYSE